MERLYGISEQNNGNLRDIFGSSYIVLNNYDELSRNYQELLTLRNRKLNDITNFIAKDNSKAEFYLESWEIDLLLLTPFPGKEDSKMKYYTYYCFKKLDFIKLLKGISTGSHELTQDEYDLLYRFIHNRLEIEKMISSSKDGTIAFNLHTIKVLWNLITSRQLTFGHNIKAYERLCNKLNLSKYQNGPHLELKTPNF